ncbi:DNA cytosine methyltransferase [Bacillus altitudinis]|uniref:DNA cytosine methyltransferase n=1 Tax=Bacillus altitudinis TaxID=293387 RepID=UPI0024A8A9BF|nr:DNA cytosine methyltransferase [Bacillus altitudinis]MDI6648884.1 DNA cytosine methyltransferase [Bacillus altitudinis]MDI6663342.1 DNA cytosine methyltransferase [Bacillus altitudinis]
MRVLDLFAGAGGLSEGFIQEEFEVIAKIEKSKPACETLITRNCYHLLKNSVDSYQYENYIKGIIDKNTLISYAKKYGFDENTIINLEIGENTIDLAIKKIKGLLKDSTLDGIIGGPPCQAYSLIGRSTNEKKKKNDKRIYLYEYYIKFLEEFNPKFFIFENVKGLLSYKDIDNKPLLPKIIEAFQNCGYRIDHKLLDASKFGVPQKRERLFIYGYKHEDIEFFRRFEEEYSKENSNITINQLFSDLPKIKSGQKYSQFEYTLASTKYLNNTEIRPENWTTLTQHFSRPNNKNDLEIYKLVATSKQHGVNILYSDLPKRLIKHNNTESFLDRFKALNGNSISHTIVAHIAKDGHYYIHPDSKQNRSISVREAARIQTFPDTFYFETSRTASFTQIGNAVPPLLARKLANKIRAIHQ